MKLLKKYWARLKLNVKFTICFLGLLLIPISMFYFYTFRNTEQHSIDNNIKYMQTVMEKGCQTISENVEAVNMSTLVVTEDSKLMELLRRTSQGEEISIEELRRFNTEQIGYLQRMINSNPNLYAVRVYDCCDAVQEMLPVLYRSSRMKGQQWGNEENPEGWYLGFRDSVFQVETTAPEIAAMVTPVNDYVYGKIATVEVAVRMEKMFPDIYDESDGYYGCFLDSRGNIYDSGEMRKEDKDIVGEVCGGEENTEEITVVYRKKDGRHLIVSSSYLKSLDGTLILICDISEDMHYVHTQSMVLVFILVLMILLLSFGINQIVKSLLKRFYGIIESIRQTKNGQSIHADQNWGIDEIGELGNQVNALIDEREQLIEENYRKDILTKNAELKALHNQINAHFLYNVLGAINMIAEIDGEEVIADAVIALGDMMHYSLQWDSGEVELGKEIKYIQDYLALTNIRYDHQIILQLSVPEEMLLTTIPKMTLQPIVENSVKHGLKEIRYDTVLEIHGFFEKRMRYIEITDHGEGITSENLEKLRMRISGEIAAAATESGHGVAMRNIQERLVITYGKDAGLEIESEEGKYTKVRIRIPEKVTTKRTL